MRHILLFISIFCFHAAIAQHPVFYQLNDEAGLPSNEVYSIVQDDFGYIWLGCDAGLYRYDGFKYKHYSCAKQNGRGISFLQIDAKQRVWCKNFYGQIYRVEGDSLKIVKAFSTSDPSHPHFDIDPACNLWVWDAKQLLVYKESGEHLKSIGLMKDAEQVIALKFFQNDLFVFFDDLSVSKLDLNTNQFGQVGSETQHKGFSKNCMALEHQKQLYFFVESADQRDKFRIYKLNGGRLELFRNFSSLKKEERLYSMVSDKKSLWVTSSFGAFCIDEPGKIFFGKEKISWMLHDREGQFWFSSLQSGIFVIPQMEVKKYSSENSGLKDHNLVALKGANKEHLLMGSYSGKVFGLDAGTDSIAEKYTDRNERFISVKFIEKNERYTIVSRGRFCIVDNYSGKQYFPRTSNVRDAVIVGDTAYLVNSEFTSKVYLPEMIRTLDVEYTYLSRRGGRSIEYDEKNKDFYLLLSDGLYVFGSSGVLTELQNGNEKILGSSLRYKNGIIWVASISGGVYGIDQRKIRYHFSERDLLKENTVRVIGVDDNYVWVGTENYLHRIHILSKETGFMNISNSVNPKDINAIQTFGEDVCLATNKGLIRFPVELNWKNTVQPRIAVSYVHLNDSAFQITDRLVLPYENNNLKIGLSTISLKSKGFYQVQYRLAGLDSSWNSLNASAASVLFSRIPSGDFVFQVRALNEHGLSSEMMSIPISVDTPFWQRWWFYILIVLLTTWGVAQFFNARINYIRKRAELKNKVIVSQLTALKSQMNPHFMFNALNSIQDLILSHDVKNSNLYISKFSSLMRKVLDASGQEKIAVQDEIEILELYLGLEKLRFGSEFEFVIHTENNIDPYQLQIPSMILQPFVENAIKHGLLHKKGKKTLAIEFTLSEIVTCTITDNGVGRKRSEEIRKRQSQAHESFATKATQKRIELLNMYSDKKYNFEIIDLTLAGEPNGTKVVVHIPI